MNIKQIEITSAFLDFKEFLKMAVLIDMYMMSLKNMNMYMMSFNNMAYQQQALGARRDGSIDGEKIVNRANVDK